MMNSFITSIGVMQGRLLPKYKGRYQAHPLGYWQDEFLIAASFQFDYIEFKHVYREFNKRADQLSNLALEVCDP